MVYFNYSWPLRTFRSNERFKSYSGRELSSLPLPPFPRDLSYETYLTKLQVLQAHQALGIF